MATDKELEQAKKRFRELADKCYRQNVYCFTGFLGMAELNAFYEVSREISHVPCMVFGGNTGCERQMVRFGSEEMLGYEAPFPIVCLEICPRSEKFADRLTHRDVLGACMNLGIERSTLGDIMVKDFHAYLYCTEGIGPYIVENLSRIRHTSVICRQYTGQEERLQPVLEDRIYQVSSERLDAVVVNGRQQESVSYVPGKGDVVTVRGYGKFVYHGLSHMTRKGKCSIVVAFYV